MREAYVYVNVFNRGCQTLVAACDREILGKTFKEGKLRLEISSAFYKGSLMKVKDAVKILDEADIANLSGENIVHAALKRGLADPRAVIKISGTPHLQFMKM